MDKIALATEKKRATTDVASIQKTPFKEWWIKFETESKNMNDQ
tara:strand:+ start:363 stop:491 length:129 start_codon:yes stop_codon:yes gene_type:complete